MPTAFATPDADANIRVHVVFLPQPRDELPVWNVSAAANMNSLFLDPTDVDIPSLISSWDVVPTRQASVHAVPPSRIVGVDPRRRLRRRRLQSVDVE